MGSGRKERPGKNHELAHTEVTRHTQRLYRHMLVHGSPDGGLVRNNRAGRNHGSCSSTVGMHTFKPVVLIVPIRETHLILPK